MQNEDNQAFVDGQNLYLGTTKTDKPWRVDFKKLGSEFFGSLDDKDTKKKIGQIKKAP